MFWGKILSGKYSTIWSFDVKVDENIFISTMTSAIQYYNTIVQWQERRQRRLNVVGNWNWLKVGGGGGVGCRGGKPRQLSASQCQDTLMKRSCKSNLNQLKLLKWQAH